MERADQYAHRANIERFERLLLRGDLGDPQRQVITDLLASERRKAAARGWERLNAAEASPVHPRSEGPTQAT
jgi:hypothetical protein